MSISMKSVLMGGLLASAILGFTACQDSKKGQTQALDASPKNPTAAGASQKGLQQNEKIKMTCDAIKSLKASKDPLDHAKVKELEGNLDKGLLDARWIQFNERLLDQAHGVFVQVWKKLEPDMQTVPSSVFSETRAHLLESFSVENGLPVLKKSEGVNSGADAKNKTSIVPVITRGEDCLPKILELQIVDLKKNKLNTMATLTFNTKGNFEWRFTASVMPEAVGQRLQTLGQDVFCSARYLKGAQLSYLNCIHLGQEGFEAGQNQNKVRIEFDQFFYNLQAKDYAFQGVESRYSDLVNPDPTYSKKEIKVQVDLGPILRKFTKTPAPEGDKKPLDPRFEVSAKLPAIAASPAETVAATGKSEGEVDGEHGEEPEVEQLSATSSGDQRDQPLRKSKSKTTNAVSEDQAKPQRSEAVDSVQELNTK